MKGAEESVLGSLFNLFRICTIQRKNVQYRYIEGKGGINCSELGIFVTRSVNRVMEYE